MEVRKLFYEDSHIKDFTARVTGCTKVPEGYAVTLDATAFYPMGGGQPGDTGTLGDARVLDTREEQNTIVHLCSKSLEIGTTVQGRIDWARRFDFMQQHTGEHMVSGFVYKRYGYHNVGFHIGADVLTVDFDGPIPQEDLQVIEDMVNEAVWANLPLKCYYPTQEELPGVLYRRKRDLPWPVRIVEIPGVDSCACCGTQVQYTGEVGLVKLFSCVKFHEGVRMEMACGKRALDILNGTYSQNRQVSQAFSAKIMETGEAARRMNDALAAEKFRTGALEKRLFAAIAREYAGQGLAVRFEEALSAEGVRELADAMADFCKIAVVLSGSEEEGYNLCIVSREEDVKQLGAEAANALRGRGGGKPRAFQGRVSASRKEIETFFAKL